MSFFVCLQKFISRKVPFIMKQTITNSRTMKTTVYARQVLREKLRLEAAAHAGRLTRSVGRLTSCDELPCPEYGEEVQNERLLIDRLLYLQHCRSALERCLEQGGARLRYRWSDGVVTTTSFQRLRQGRVRVSGLEQRTA